MAFLLLFDAFKGDYPFLKKLSWSILRSEEFFAWLG
jgi:hypothetical protein